MTGLPVLFLRADENLTNELVATRQSLRKDGFKTDLSDFDFSTTGDVRAREAALTAIDSVRSAGMLPPIDLLPQVTSNSATVIWKQDALEVNRQQLDWSELHDFLHEQDDVLNSAAEAAVSGPIRFNLEASHGNAMQPRYLAPLKRDIQFLSYRALLSLHLGDTNAAAKDLFAATRALTGWQVEPVEISQLVRAACIQQLFDTSWQMLQAGGWPDDFLAKLQQEWESVNLFTNLTETVAFHRACMANVCEMARQEPVEPGGSDLLKETARSPRAALSEMRYAWDRSQYQETGSFKDEKALLLFFRDREVEMRQASQASNWVQMRSMPGVTNAPRFESEYPHSPVQMSLNMREIGIGMQRRGTTFLGRIVETEARREIIITAIALERYRGKHGAYPESLRGLSPEFLKTPPVDFMDGQPLRFRLTGTNQFILYSVGLDCIDNGGQLPKSGREALAQPFDSENPFGPPTPADLVWPSPASAAQDEALREEKARIAERQEAKRDAEESEVDWKQSLIRQERIGGIMSMNWSADTNTFTFNGRPFPDLLSNLKPGVSNKISLQTLLNPRQIITGDEPEILSFQFPVKYSVVTNIGTLLLMVDAETNEEGMYAVDCGARIQDLKQAASGDCLVAWHAIFDPPGQHAVQAELIATDTNGGEYWSKGPPVLVTSSNLCQFSLLSDHFYQDTGAEFHARLPEAHGNYVIECNTTNGARLKTITGTTTTGEFTEHWNLIDDHGVRFKGNYFDSVIHIILPQSGRSQTMRGP